MQYLELDVSRSKGISISEDIRFDGIILEKGHVINDEDIIQLKLSGISKIYGTEMSEDDISNETALGIIAAKLCGSNTAYTIGKDGICKIIAVKNGVFMCADERVAKFNRLSPNVFLNPLKPYSLVDNGIVIAELELTLPIISQNLVDDIIFSLSGNTELLSVSIQQKRQTALIYTKFYDDDIETSHFTNIVTSVVRNFSNLKLDFIKEYNAKHTSQDIANQIQKAVDDGMEVIFIVPGQKSIDKNDIIPSAITGFLDEIVNFSIPQVKMSDLIIGQKRQAKIISLPYNYGKINSDLANHYIRLAIINERLFPYDFARPQNVLITEENKLSAQEQENLFTSENKKNTKGDTNIAAVILAAGIGARAGRNKLMFELDNQPLFLKAVEAAVKSKASPVFVVTGYKAEEIEEALDNIDVNIIYNPSYRSGIKTSISLGLKSVPGFCDGALILPADMPNITPDFINKLLKSFKKNKDKQVSMVMFEGVKHNPIIWSKSLYNVADLVPENADLRPVFMEHADYTNIIEAPNSEMILDINFPNDLEYLKRK